MKPLLTSLLVATGNPGKLVEIELILQGLPFNLKTLADFAGVETVEETGQTFAENAVLKAQGYATQTGLWAVADDSGLEVDALGGAPGVRSARFAGKGATDTERVSLLLSKLALVPEEERTGRFVSVVAIADTQGALVHSARGICEGKIAFQPCGSGGFGYDPVFIPQGCNQTLAELTLDVKNQISHRARALASTRDFLRYCINQS